MEPKVVSSRQALASMEADLEQTAAAPPWYRLGPVSKARWFWPGIVLELVGMAGPAAYVLIKAKHQSVGNSFTLATVKLAWHGSVHSKAGLAVLIGGAVLVAIGGTLVARPFVSNLLIWLLAVPLASAAAAVLLGAGALIILIVVGCVYAGLDGFDFGGGSRRRKKKPA
jgi:hypothetical protein